MNTSGKKVATEGMAEENRTRISVKTPDTVQTPQVTTPPEFRNSEIHWLYRNGLHIDRNKLITILDLPKKELTEDLKTVLKDSMSRFTYFSEIAEKE